MPGNGSNANTTLRDLFADNAYNLLQGKARNLTVGDTWRLGGFKPPNLPPVQDDAVLSQLTTSEMTSLSRAIEVHMRNNGNNEGWQYVGYSCFACHVCCMCCA